MAIIDIKKEQVEKVKYAPVPDYRDKIYILMSAILRKKDNNELIKVEYLENLKTLLELELNPSVTG